MEYSAHLENMLFWLLSGMFSACIGAVSGYLAFRFSIRALRREFQELAYDVETVTKTVKRRNARDAMQEKRDNDVDYDDLLAAARAAVAAEGTTAPLSATPDQKAALRVAARKKP